MYKLIFNKENNWWEIIDTTFLVNNTIVIFVGDKAEQRAKDYCVSLNIKTQFTR